MPTTPSDTYIDTNWFYVRGGATMPSDLRNVYSDPNDRTIQYNQGGRKPWRQYPGWFYKQEALTVRLVRTDPPEPPAQARYRHGDTQPLAVFPDETVTVQLPPVRSLEDYQRLAQMLAEQFPGMDAHNELDALYNGIGLPLSDLDYTALAQKARTMRQPVAPPRPAPDERLTVTFDMNGSHHYGDPPFVPLWRKLWQKVLTVFNGEG